MSRKPRRLTPILEATVREVQREDERRASIQPLHDLGPNGNCYCGTRASMMSGQVGRVIHHCANCGRLYMEWSLRVTPKVARP